MQQIPWLPDQHGQAKEVHGYQRHNGAGHSPTIRFECHHFNAANGHNKSPYQHNCSRDNPSDASRFLCAGNVFVACHAFFSSHFLLAVVGFSHFFAVTAYSNGPFEFVELRVFQALGPGAAATFTFRSDLFCIKFIQCLNGRQQAVGEDERPYANHHAGECQNDHDGAMPHVVVSDRGQDANGWSAHVFQR